MVIRASDNVEQVLPDIVRPPLAKGGLGGQNIELKLIHSLINTIIRTASLLVIASKPEVVDEVLAAAMPQAA